MLEDTDAQVRNSEPSDYSTDAQALQVVISALQKLDARSRQRLLSTVSTFFGLDIALGKGQTDNRSQNPSSDVNNGYSPTKPGSFSEDRSLSPKEFLLQKKPAQDVDRIACLAYYMTHYQNQPHFKTLDLSILNTEAAQVKFSNAAKSVSNAAAAGLLVPAGKGMKQLSANGELYVQALPDRAAAKAAIAHGRPRRKTKRVRQPNSSDSES